MCAGDKDEVQKGVFCVVQWRENKEPTGSFIGLIALEVHRCSGMLLPVERLGWNLNPQVDQRRWVHRNPVQG